MKIDDRIIMTGATGNTGLATLRLIRQLQPERPILALVRATSDTSLLRELGVLWHVADLERPETYREVVRPGDVLLETANLRHARVMLPELANLGVTRAFCVTTTGVFSKHHSYSSVYQQIENEMRDSPISVTILRPSMIYGNERDYNMHKLLKFIARSPVYPVFGSGQALMQPVHVDDLAQGIARAVVYDVHGEFNLAGPQALPYRQVVDEAFRAVGRKGVLFFFPVKPIASVVRVLERLPRFPLKHEQVIRLQEDKVFDISASQRQLLYAPRPFSLGIAQEASRLREVGLL